MYLKNYLKEYLEYLKNIRGYSPQTIKTYSISLKELIKNHEIEEREDYTIVNIMPLRLHLANHSKRAQSTKLSAIRSYIKYINTMHHKNIKLKGAQSPKTPKTLPKPLKRANILEVLNSASLQDRVIIKMLYSLGLRISELSSLKLENISNEWVRVLGKGSKMREIPIIGSLRDDLNKYINHYNPKEYLLEKSNKPLTNSQIRYRVNKLFKAYGVKATPHQLRHSFASDLLEEGARVSDVSELLGHSSMATTQIYTKLTNSTKLKNYLKAHPLK